MEGLALMLGRVKKDSILICFTLNKWPILVMIRKEFSVPHYILRGFVLSFLKELVTGVQQNDLHP